MIKREKSRNTDKEDEEKATVRQKIKAYKKKWSNTDKKEGSKQPDEKGNKTRGKESKSE